LTEIGISFSLQTQTIMRPEPVELGASDSDSGSPRSIFLESILWDVSDPLDQLVVNPPTMNEAQKFLGWNVETACSF
jgi:hypothetical protein